MAKRHVEKHVKTIKKLMKRHRTGMWRHFRKVYKHDYRVRAAGLPKGRKMRAHPKWCVGPIPKTGPFPKRPARMGKKAGAWWTRHKKQAQAVQNKAKGMIAKLWSKGKQLGKNVLGKAADQLSAHSDDIINAASRILENHLENAASHADRVISEKIDSGASKVKSKVSSYKPKKGGMLLQAAGLKRKRKKGGMMLEAAGLKKRRKAGMMLMNAAGLPSHKKKGGSFNMQRFLDRAQQQGNETRLGRDIMARRQFAKMTKNYK